MKTTSAIHELQCKFDRIEDKNKCLRVRILDQLSDKLLVWSKNIKEISTRIDAPCAISFNNKPTEHISIFKEFEQADYYYDASMSTYTDIKGLKAGKSLDDCTFAMRIDGSLISRTQRKIDMDKIAKENLARENENLRKINDELAQPLTYGE